MHKYGKSKRKSKKAAPHVVIVNERWGVSWRTSDGRSGSDPDMGPGKRGPTLAAVISRFLPEGATFEVI
jgi:hypothetical protein